MAFDYKELDPGIRGYVKVLRDGGVSTYSSCEGRDNPRYSSKRDGPHSGDWPYISIGCSPAEAYCAVGVALRAGLPVRSIEQRWFVDQGDAISSPQRLLSGPQWRITFWRKDGSQPR